VIFSGLEINFVKRKKRGRFNRVGRLTAAKIVLDAEKSEPLRKPRQDRTTHMDMTHEYGPISRSTNVFKES